MDVKEEDVMEVEEKRVKMKEGVEACRSEVEEGQSVRTRIPVPECQLDLECQSYPECQYESASQTQSAS
ncbi:hypothetical protein Pcinc_035242 [Petrolisthes cinctipes]|uniref:Uncharacterized protein n=1 Tax=Petrolisthes cinctipes TaxID=88211 RepID=A0AAE1BWV8_PETCI|nr:hypothetical protein Pcinc_035242 [Petrolisthes cinctipes]